MANPASNQLFLVSTSHMDWDWNQSFEQYYANGTGSSYNNCVTAPTPAVREILDNAFALMQNTSYDPAYQYHLAEVAWLQRYLQDNPNLYNTLSQLPNASERFTLLGGGITSPDNLLSNGEAFIRNYLLGRAFAKKSGFGAHLRNVCWIPDDFGHDPQLPVVIAAMGMEGVSFWRVPGNEPSVTYAPLDGSASIATQLEQNGVTFYWLASDGSTVLAQQMWDGYGVIWNQSAATQRVTGSNNCYTQEQVLNWFVTQGVVQYGNIYLAPCGGDFSLPSANLINAYNNYDNQYANANGIAPVMGSFSDFIAAVHEYEQQSNTKPYTRYMDASNFWTGHFASRVQLKINHQRSSNYLMAAETLSTLLRANSAQSFAVLDSLNKDINTAWENLIPSTHHDYINGTAPDSIYWTEQLPLSQTALRQSEAAAEQAIQLLGSSVAASPEQYEIPYVVANPLGCDRRDSTLVEIPLSPELAGIKSVRFQSGEQIPVQITQSGTLLFPCPNGSTAYQVVYLSHVAVSAPINPPLLDHDTVPNYFLLNNGVVQIQIISDEAWCIYSMLDIQNGGQELLPDLASRANVIQLYYESDPSNKASAQGNLYQMGNEQKPTYTNGYGFFTDATGTFRATSGEIIENGPYRWHFMGTISNTIQDPAGSGKEITTVLTVEYILEYQEPLVRVRISGNAPGNSSNNLATSVVSTWDVFGENDQVAVGMEYGTGNHWNNAEFVPYWNGPTFRPVHDYCSFIPSAAGSSEGGAPAMYNLGMRSWAYYNNQLLGILFRNPVGTQRGAHGSDTAHHVQNFAYRIPGAGSPQSCQPLQESLCFQVRQMAAPVKAMNSGLSPMPQSGYLAAITNTNPNAADNAIIRVARTQEGSGNTPTRNNPSANEALPFSCVLRLYQPTNRADQSYNLTLPFLSGQQPVIKLQTALEEDIPGATAPSFSNNTISLYNMNTLTTLWIQADGKQIPGYTGSYYN